jgi:hypothetical protein
MTTAFQQLNDGWNAEPNVPEAQVLVESGNVILAFFLNPMQFPQFAEGQRARVCFTGAWRYRLGPTNDEGWYRGQCRFSGVAPAWGNFYEVTGDLLLSRCPNDWTYVRASQDGASRHFLFYLRDDTFECDASAFVVDLGKPPVTVTLVLDASCGDGLAAFEPPIWVCESPVNLLAAERLRTKRSQDVTTFKRISESEDETIDDMLSTIDEHHPGWAALSVVGSAASPAVRATFAPFGPGEFLESAWGFRFVRSTEALTRRGPR